MEPLDQYEQRSVMMGHLERLNKGKEVMLDDIGRWNRKAEQFGLTGECILQVDNEFPVLEKFIGPVIAATRRKCDFVLHKYWGADSVAGVVHDRIERMRSQGGEKTDPLVLMDARLGNGVLGPEVAEKLLLVDDSIRIIGFSSMDRWASPFAEVGVKDFVLKQNDNPMASLQMLGKLMQRRGESEE